MENSRSSARTGGIVSIRSRAGYRPDFRSLASGQVAAARDKLGLSHAEFAGYLSRLLGWTVAAEAVERWEHGAIPPGDVLLACAVAAPATPGDVPAFPLNATAEQAAALLSGAGPRGILPWQVPHSFPADALAGSWVTCYQFRHDGAQYHHADIARITAETDRHIWAANHPPAPRTEGRTAPFRNEIEAELASRHLVGHWKNTNDTRYFGAVHLAVLPGETVMDGYYTGFASDILVSAGRWRWVRLDPGSLPGADLSGVTLRDPAALYELIMNYSLYDEPLTLADIGEEA